MGSWKDGEEVAGKREGLPELLAGSYKVAALEDKTGWATSVGLFALNGFLLPVGLTWNRYRQSPLGRPDPTMGRRALDRCGTAELTSSENVVDNEGEGPE